MKDNNNNTVAWRARSQRRRAAHGLGLVPMRVWAQPEDVTPLSMMAAEAEYMIDAEVKRRYGENAVTASLEEIRAMADSGQIKAPQNAGPGEDLPGDYWDDAKMVHPE